jgi:hypothetical protein
MSRVNGYKIISTKCCGSIYKTSLYGSINLMAEEYWTDGYRHNSLTPLDGGVRKCKCKNFIF